MSCHLEGFWGAVWPEHGTEGQRSWSESWSLPALFLWPWVSHLNLSFHSCKWGQTRASALSVFRAVVGSKKIMRGKVLCKVLWKSGFTLALWALLASSLATPPLSGTSGSGVVHFSPSTANHCLPVWGLQIGFHFSHDFCTQTLMDNPIRNHSSQCKYYFRSKLLRANNFVDTIHFKTLSGGPVVYTPDLLPLYVIIFSSFCRHFLKC